MFVIWNMKHYFKKIIEIALVLSKRCVFDFDVIFGVLMLKVLDKMFLISFRHNYIEQHGQITWFRLQFGLFIEM